MPTSQGQVIRLVAESHPRTFMVFLGAGASKSSGVPLASEMIQEWRKVAYDDEGRTDLSFDAWCVTKKDAWFGKDDEYSLLFEALFPNEWARQEYIEKKVANVSPSWGYLYLANLLERNYFNVCLTTNFDDLLQQACSTYVGYNPVVCAFDSEVMSVSLTSPRAKIIKLHGDYLFKKLRNTKEELMQLDPQMQQTWEDLAKLNGMVVLGYNGNDISVMSVIERCLQKGDPFFDHGIYWGVRTGSQPSKTVQDLAQRYPHCFLVFEFDDFDTFFAKLHATVADKHPECQIALPKPVVEPYEALKQRYALLTRAESATAKTDPLIDRDRQELSRTLNLPWAKADHSQLDLLQAQLALGQRDYKTALKLVASFVEAQPKDIDGLTTWGYALATQAEVEHSDAPLQAAIEKWNAATALEGNGRVALQAHSGLVRAYERRQAFSEAIAECEILLKAVPSDRGVLEELCMLLANAGRFVDALTRMDQLIAQYPNNSDYYAAKSNFLDQRGSVDEARQELQQAINLDPSKDTLHVRMAQLLTKLDRRELAGQELEQAARLAPDVLATRLALIDFYSSRQDFLAALPHAEKAAQIEPGSAESRGWLAQTYMMLGRLPEAECQMREYLRLSPNDTRAEVMAGLLYIRLGQLGVAEQNFRAATQIAPNDPRMWLYLGMLFRLQERPGDVAQIMQRLMQMDPATAQNFQMQLNNWPVALARILGTAGAGHTPFGAPPYANAQAQGFGTEQAQRAGQIPQSGFAPQGQPPHWNAPSSAAPNLASTNREPTNPLARWASLFNRF